MNSYSYEMVFVCEIECIDEDKAKHVKSKMP